MLNPCGFLEGVQWSDFLKMADTSRLWGHSPKLGEKRLRLDLSKFTSTLRIVFMWHGLPREVVIASPARAFKNEIKAHPRAQQAKHIVYQLFSDYSNPFALNV